MAGCVGSAAGLCAEVSLSLARSRSGLADRRGDTLNRRPLVLCTDVRPNVATVAVGRAGAGGVLTPQAKVARIRASELRLHARGAGSAVRIGDTRLARKGRALFFGCADLGRGVAHVGRSAWRSAAGIETRAGALHADALGAAHIADSSVLEMPALCALRACLAGSGIAARGRRIVAIAIAEALKALLQLGVAEQGIARAVIVVGAT